MSDIEKLANDNIKLVYYVCRKMGFYGSDLNIENTDEFGAGMLGLAKACMKYDESKGFKFTTFAYRVIQNEILCHIRVSKRYDNIGSLDVFMGADDSITILDTITSNTDIQQQIEDRIEIKRIIEMYSKNNNDKKNEDTLSLPYQGYGPEKYI